MSTTIAGARRLAKGLCKNYFRFWRERHRARCEARGRECIRSDTRPTEERSRWPGAAPPRRAGGLWLAGFVAPRSQTAAGMLPRRASPASQIPSSKTGINFCTDPKWRRCAAQKLDSCTTDCKRVVTLARRASDQIPVLIDMKSSPCFPAPLSRASLLRILDPLNAAQKLVLSTTHLTGQGF